MFKKVAIISSKKDLASTNIKEQLISIFPFKETELLFDSNKVYELKDNRLDAKIFTINSKLVNAENLDELIDAELFVFISKHQSKSSIPSLCIHTQGNISEAQLGGRPKNIAVSPACYLKQGLKNLNELNSINFDVVQEATHHGPTINKPSFFIEVGSTEKEWSNQKACSIVAVALMKTLRSVEPCISAIGIGGPHTTPNFRKIILNTNIGLGHVCAHYNLPDLDRAMIEQMLDKTTPKPSLIILDWKGLKHEKQRILKIIEEISSERNVKVIRTKDFKINP